MKTLILIDGHSLAFREYFALERTGMSTSDNQPTWAVYGFFKALFDLLKKIKPDAIAVTFDVSKKTFRTEKYSEYKANRESMPDNMKSQMDLIKEGLQAFNIPIYTKEGFEADDVIGTISKQASELGHKTYILTGDQDSFQLIDKEGLIKVLIPITGELIEYDWDKVYEKWGVYPDQVIDYKALRGDKSDNIPGIKGIGEKTTQKLLTEFKTLENIFNNVDKIQNSASRGKIANGKDIALLSKFLATIIRDVDINFDFNEACIEYPDINKVRDFFQKMQFFGFIKNLNKILLTFNANCNQSNSENLQLDLFANLQESQIKNYDNEDFDCENIENNIEKLTYILEKQKIFSLCIETLENDNNIISKLAFGIKDNKKVKIYFIEANSNLKTNLITLKKVLENPNIKKTVHNAKKEYTILKKYEINLNGIVFDTMLASYVKDPSRKHELRTQAIEHLNHILLEEDNDICTNTYTILKLTEFWESNLDEKEKTLITEIEVPLSLILADMEEYGVSIDTEYLKILSNEFNQHLKELEEKIHKAAKKDFNVNSPKQVSEILYNHLKIKPIKKGKNKFSTSADVLEELSEKYAICKNLLEYRQYAKLKSTYTDILPTLISPLDGKIHTSFNQTITTTGRLSSSNPNLQNIPTRTENANKIRKAFIPQDINNQVLISADYSQIELRLLAHCSDDKTLIDAFNSGEDVHTKTASRIFEVSPEEVTKSMRQKAKAVNFGIVYGQSIYGLSNVLKVSSANAEEFLNKYFETYPKIKDYMQNTIDFAYRNGYVETIFGRKRYLGTNLNSSNRHIKDSAERAAINQPLQGSAADLIKMAMINLSRRLTNLNLKSKIILQVHDELIIETPLDELDIVKTIVKQAMELDQPLKVPLVVDINSGKNWLEL